mmetsp:Transcript_41849/g.87588  ORF Transcript_41849/g.87588 Transcript_41849/m.87588 type:complete len:214 (+) Transcript_41849:257-898(+)
MWRWLCLKYRCVGAMNVCLVPDLAVSQTSLMSHLRACACISRDRDTLLLLQLSQQLTTQGLQRRIATESRKTFQNLNAAAQLDFAVRCRKCIHHVRHNPCGTHGKRVIVVHITSWIVRCDSSQRSQRRTSSRLERWLVCSSEQLNQLRDEAKLDTCASKCDGLPAFFRACHSGHENILSRCLHGRAVSTCKLCHGISKDSTQLHCKGRCSLLF